MPDQTIQIEISTKATGTGVKESVADITKLKDETISAAQVLKDSATPAMAGLGKATGESGLKAEELKEVFTEIGKELPGAGLISRLFGNPLTGALSTLMDIAGVVKEITANLVTVSNTGFANGSLSRSLEDAKKMALEADLAHQAFLRTLHDTDAALDGINTKFTNLTASIRATAVAEAEMDNKQKALALARINLLEQQGKLNGPQATGARLKVEEQFTQKGLERDVREKESAIQAKRDQQSKLAKIAEQQEGEANAASADKKAAEEKAAALQETIAKQKEALKQANAQMKAIENATFVTPAMFEQGRSARRLRDRLEVNIGLNERELPDVLSERDKAAERYANATGAAKSARQQADHLAREIPGEQAVADAGYVSAGRAAAVESQTRWVTALTEAIKQKQQLMESTAAALEAGKGIDGAVQKSIEALAQQISQLERKVSALKTAPAL